MGKKLKQIAKHADLEQGIIYVRSAKRYEDLLRALAPVECVCWEAEGSSL